MRIIVQFQSDEDMATFAEKHPALDEDTGDGEEPVLRTICQLALAPIAVMDIAVNEIDESLLDKHFPESEGIVFKEIEAEFFLSATSSNSVLNMDSISTSIYGPFQGDGVTIAIVDGGIDATHPDLQRTAITRHEYLVGEAGLDAGHGTAIAGIICGSGKMSRNNYKGLARNVNLVDCVAFDKTGRGLLGDILAAIDAAVESGARIVCLPFSSRPDVEPSAILEYYLRVLVEGLGSIFCCGAGNFGPLQGTIGMPGCFDCVITTGSTSPTFKVSRFSGRGNRDGAKIKPDFCLPGERTVSLNCDSSAFKDTVLDENEHYAIFTGNSVSVAILTGIVAAILSAKPDAKPLAVKRLLMASCNRIRKSAPISSGTGILAPVSVFRNMDLMYAFAKGFPTIAREAAITTAVVVFFSIASAIMFASFL